MANASPTRTQILSRVLAGLLGGWGFVWGFSVLSITLLVTVGWEYGQALTLVMMLAFVVFLVVLCWSFAAARAWRVWLVLAGGGGLMTVLASLLLRNLTS